MATDVQCCVIMAAEVPTTLWVGYGSRIRGCGVCGGARGVQMRGRMLQAKYRFIYNLFKCSTDHSVLQFLYTLGIRFMVYTVGIYFRLYSFIHSAGSSQRSQRSRGQGTKG